MAKKKKIIEKIKINQFIVKNKKCTSNQRRMAYLELKRLNSLKESGNIVKMPDYEMINVLKKHRPYEHNYLIYKTDKKNNVKVNKISHGKMKRKVPFNSVKSYLGLNIIEEYKRKDKKNIPLKFYDFYESNINKIKDIAEVKSLLNLISKNEINKSIKKASQ